MQIEKYRREHEKAVIDLILHIQQNEFGVPVTIEDQPDLLDVENFYCRGMGNFWVATENSRLIGTIALIDIGNKQSALRKMFVHKDYRGKEKGVGQQLLNYLTGWCKQKGIDEVYLGTSCKLQAAQRFYLKNGFVEVEKQSLPVNFPLMQVDNMFFALHLK